jgi:NAD(P)-dependent dehydrogenase (short-subunit alcohol dehydrogenase family)
MTKPYAVPSQEGRTAIVTGANAGIGLWTAVGLAKAGAHVVMLCRDARRGEEARRFVAAKAGRTPDLILADFTDLKRLHAAGTEIAARYPAIQILVNNAGLFAPARTLTRDGYEMTFAVNHLAPFLLTQTLLPDLERSGVPSRYARIVNVASAAANRAALNLDDLMSARRYHGPAAYAQSKLANILFTKELARRLPPKPVTANCLHPGVVATDFGNKSLLSRLIWRAIKPFMISPEQGAVNSLYVATSPDIEGSSGAYFVKRKPAGPNPIAEDPAIAAQLWAESERLVAAALQA